MDFEGLTEDELQQLTQARDEQYADAYEITIPTTLTIRVKADTSFDARVLAAYAARTAGGYFLNVTDSLAFDADRAISAYVIAEPIKRVDLEVRRLTLEEWEA